MALPLSEAASRVPPLLEPSEHVTRHRRLRVLQRLVKVGARDGQVQKERALCGSVRRLWPAVQPTMQAPSLERDNRCSLAQAGKVRAAKANGAVSEVPSEIARELALACWVACEAARCEAARIASQGHTLQLLVEDCEASGAGWWRLATIRGGGWVVRFRVGGRWWAYRYTDRHRWCQRCVSKAGS